MNDKTNDAIDGLHIHLDMSGLAALLKAIDTAMEGGRGRLDLGPGGCGVAARAEASGDFATAVVTFARPKEPGEARVDPSAPALLEPA